MSLKQAIKDWVYNSALRETWTYHRWRFLAEPAVYTMNFIVQKIFRVNGKTKWSVHFTSMVRSPEKIRIGYNSDRCFATSPGCYFQGWNGIIIGDDVLFGPGVKMMSANHDIDGDDMMKLMSAPMIVIGNRCWLGANVCILPGVNLGDDVVVGAGAVITHSFPSNVILVGNPARILKERTTELNTQ